MRWNEIINEFAVDLPSKYEIDPETNLAMNLPKQWSQSPYLGAVKSSKGSGYMAQIHIPQHVWSEVIDQKKGKWRNAPDSFFHETGNRRPSMIISGFQDPRRAAWIAQEVLFGGHTAEIIEDYFDERYNGGDGSIWRSLASKAPSFTGKPLDASDEEKFFSQRDPKNPAVIQKKNADAYNSMMPDKIKKALVDFYSQNRSLAKKRLGFNGSLAQLEDVVDKLIASKGVEYFVTTPGSVKLKDIASLQF